VAGAIAWIAAPGHVAMPLDWRMILPVVTNVLCGIAFYCGGVMIGLSNARLYGSRAAGVGVPLVCTVAQFAVTEFWQAIVWCAVGITITVAAAWGSFIAKERFENQPLAMRAATGITVSAELALAGVIALILVTVPLSSPPLSSPLSLLD